MPKAESSMPAACCNCQPSTINPLVKRALLFLIILFQICLLRAQSTDSTQVVDTVLKKTGIPADSAVRRLIKVRTQKKLVDSVALFSTDTLRFSSKKPADFSNLPTEWIDILKTQPFFNLLGKPMRLRAEKYERDSYDVMFYLLLLMLFYFAIVKLFFGKYLGNLLTLFFRASMRQQQLREQVLQSPFPSVLLNNLFVFSGGLYGAFLLRFYHYGNPDMFWVHFLYCTVLLAVLYLLKFLVLKIVGWIFNINRTVDTYLFVVFMTNKIIGIFLLPFLVLISFSGPLFTEIAITLSLIMIGIFYVYRFFGGYATLHKEIKISGLHFILYLCAFEIAPLLLIYKVLLTYLEKAY